MTTRTATTGHSDAPEERETLDHEYAGYVAQFGIEAVRRALSLACVMPKLLPRSSRNYELAVAHFTLGDGGNLLLQVPERVGTDPTEAHFATLSHPLVIRI